MKELTVATESIEFHPVSEGHPQMNEFEFKALVSDMGVKGQLEPVKLYRGRVVDGRHRTWAAKELGIDVVKCVELPNNTTLAELKDIVLSTETRRHQSGTQRACSAYLEMISEGTENTTAAEQARKYGVNKAYISMCKSVADSMGLSVLEGFVGGKAQNLLVNGTYSKYSSIQKLYSALKRKDEIKIIKKPLGDLRINYNQIEMEARQVMDRLSSEEQEYFINAFVEFRELKIAGGS